MPKTTHQVCKVDDLPVGERKIVEIDGKSIGVFNVHGKFHAIRNSCPHQLAPLCLGRVSGTTLPGKVGEYNYGRDGEIIRCPWHGWEFDITTGRSVFNPHRCRVRSYQVTVETTDDDGAVVQEQRRVGEDEPDPAVDTYEVTVEDAWVVLHV
jgi:3-phenylpropionate/trans-cinnamate dioxygenase ferredoxin subunit